MKSKHFDIRNEIMTLEYSLENPDTQLSETKSRYFDI